MDELTHTDEKVEYPHTDGEFTILGPECFTDGLVISYKGAGYYKACEAFVADLDDGGQSFCVKRVDHPGMYHEDYQGRLKLRAEVEGQSANREELTVIWPRKVPDGVPVTKAGVRATWKELVTPLQEGANLAGEMSDEVRTLLAVMRHFYAAMPEDEEVPE